MLLWSNGVRRGHLNHRGQGRIATAQQRHRRRRRRVVDEDGIVRRYVVTYLNPDRLQKQDSILIGCQPPAFQPEHTCFIMNKFEHVPWRWRSLYSEVQSLNVLISGKWLGRGSLYNEVQSLKMSIYIWARAGPGVPVRLNFYFQMSYLKINLPG